MSPSCFYFCFTDKRGNFPLHPPRTPVWPRPRASELEREEEVKHTHTHTRGQGRLSSAVASSSHHVVFQDYIDPDDSNEDNYVEPAESPAAGRRHNF